MISGLWLSVIVVSTTSLGFIVGYVVGHEAAMKYATRKLDDVIDMLEKQQ